MTKSEIFDDVVSICKHDAAFCKDEPGADADAYRRQIRDDMDDERFLYLVQAYLASFGVMGHLAFRDSERGRLPFAVHRWQDALYVTDVAENAPVQRGDRIVRIDGISVPEYAARHEVMLFGESEDRQGFAWFSLLSFAQEITIDRDGELHTLPITLDAIWPKTVRYTCRQLEEGVAYLQLKDFGDDAAIHALIRENDALLRRSEFLIIDVRDNDGGNDSAYQPLLAFCTAESEPPHAAGPFDTGMEINYSVRNCDARLAQFESMLEQELPQATREMLTAFAAELKQNRGKGFVRFGDDGGNEESAEPCVGTALPRKVFVLTDEGCASSGDAFVYEISKYSKVTVVGRPTMGILDYSNCSGQDYGRYVLVYPTSRLLCLDEGVHMRRCGIPVDVHIPWTPGHCRRDADLDAVLALIHGTE